MENARADKSIGEVGLRPWAEGDLPLLERLLGDPAMTEHLGGPETPDQLRARHGRYLGPADEDGGAMFVILAGQESAGSIGFWKKPWRSQIVWETGWSVLPEFQGQRIASRAAGLIIERARSAGKHRYLHAFPGVDNSPSNAVCRKAGFTLLGPVEFEYPAGHMMQCNDWRIDLTGEGGR